MITTITMLRKSISINQKTYLMITSIVQGVAMSWLRSFNQLLLSTKTMMKTAVKRAAVRQFIPWLKTMTQSLSRTMLQFLQLNMVSIILNKTYYGHMILALQTQVIISYLKNFFETVAIKPAQLSSTQWTMQVKVSIKLSWQ